MSTPIIWITGAAGGIGNATTAAALAAGYRCVLQSRRPIDPPSSDCVAVCADISAEDGAAAAIAASMQAFGAAPDQLCHTAGAVALAAFTRTTLAQWHGMMAANATSAFIALKAFAEARSAAGGGGSALLFSSVAARIGTPNHVAVAAAKGAVEALVRASAADLSARRMRINALALGLTETPMTAGFMRDERSRLAVSAQYPLGRVGTADEVAAAALWLLSDQAGWITGQILPVDGGFTAIRPMVR